MSSLVSSLVLLRISLESQEMFTESSCIPDERARDLECITKPPLVPDAYQAVMFFAFFLCVFFFIFKTKLKEFQKSFEELCPTPLLSFSLLTLS